MTTPNSNTDAHWNDLYAAGDRESFGWYEPRPTTLVDIEAILAVRPDTASLIDVGAGLSGLPGELCERLDVTVLDRSATAIELLDQRLGTTDCADRVEFVVSDVLEFAPTRTWSIWHDRATFHFLVEPDDQQRYVDVAARAVVSGGHLVIATFAPEGPEQCAGLPVQRYSAEHLAQRFEPDFETIVSRQVTSADTAGDHRPYTICTLKRRL